MPVACVSGNIVCGTVEKSIRFHVCLEHVFLYLFFANMSFDFLVHFIVIYKYVFVQHMPEKKKNTRMDNIRGSPCIYFLLYHRLIMSILAE